MSAVVDGGRATGPRPEERPPGGDGRLAAPAAIGARPPSAGAAWAGLLVVDKPAGVTSHDVVALARRRLGAPAVGHLGTLDPGASGLLLLAVGAATRCVAVWQGGEKTYEGALEFGVVTDTQDLQGRVLERRPVTDLDEARVREAALALVGEIDQVPPMVSALKHQGQRLYRLARRGQTVERAPRRVRVAEWEWLGFDLPSARFRVRCSGGTYVRTLAHDLGAALGPGAALARLRRLRSEPFGLERSVTLRELTTLPADATLERAGIPLDRALETLPALVLDPAAAEAVGRGGRPAIERGPGTGPPAAGGPRSVVLRDVEGRALALGELLPDPAFPERVLVCPHVVFPWAVREGRA